MAGRIVQSVPASERGLPGCPRCLPWLPCILRRLHALGRFTLFKRSSAAVALLAMSIAGCGAATAPTAIPASTQSSSRSFAQSADILNEPNLLKNAYFKSGTLAPGWSACGSVKSASKVESIFVYTGKYSELNGSTSSPEIDGTAGICQTVSVPLGGVLTLWVYEGTDDSIKNADQEVDMLTTDGVQIGQIYSEAVNTRGWVEKSVGLAPYYNQTVQLYIGVRGRGTAHKHVYQFVDDVQLTGGGSIFTPSPSPSP
jgi:hypothetical protein